MQPAEDAGSAKQRFRAWVVSFTPSGERKLRADDRMLLRFPSAVARERAIDAWLSEQPGELGSLARKWFAKMRECGQDVRELLHDGHPTACVGDAPFGYVNVFKAHVNVGFFHGATLPDPDGLLEGTGKYMRHVKLTPGRAPEASALSALIDAAYRDIRNHLGKG